MWVLLTTPGGRLGTPVKYLGPTGQVATGDVDLDGDLDIATTGSAKIDLYLNDGAGAFPKIADIIAGALDPAADVAPLRERVRTLTEAFPLYPGLPSASAAQADA